MPEEGYITPSIETDATQVTQDILDGFADRIPGWVPSDAHVETALAGVIGPLIADNLEVSTQVLRAIFTYWVQELVGVAVIDATEASGTATVTALDTAGYTLAAGTQFSIRDTTGGEFGFEVRENISIPAGSTSTAFGGVVLDAVETGVAGSGLSGTVTPIDSVPWLATVTLVGQTTGGVDGEDTDTYLSRSSDSLALLTPRPILPVDFAQMARQVAGVQRALALDGYNPANGTSSNERMVAVAVVGATGTAVSAAVKAQVDTLLQSEREVNFVVNVIDPTFTAIAVTFTAVAYPGYNTVDLRAAVILAVQNYLSPARWGAEPTLGDGFATPWINEPVVRVTEMFEVVNRVDGVRYVSALTLNGGTVDINLTGAAPLTTAGAVTGTIT